MWLDVDTRLTLRSQGLRRGPGGWPIDGDVRTMEVTAIELGQPPAALFEIRRPDGVRVLSDQEKSTADCVRFGWCLETPGPVVTPPPAPGVGTTATAEEIVRLGDTAAGEMGPYAITIIETLTGMADPGTRTVVLYDGAGRYRIERTPQVGTIWEQTSVALIGDGYAYVSEIQIDGTETWRPYPRVPENGVAYPLRIEAGCDAGWEHLGVDLVAGRAADHVGCQGDAMNTTWIDRETHLVVRVDAFLDDMSGTSVREVTDLRLGAVDGVEWDLPEDADLRN
jgi:hypothetical protein